MQKEKELVIRMAEAEQELVDAVNSILQKNNLPFFLFEPIVDKIHRQIIDGKNAELTSAKEREAAAAAKTSKEEKK